MYHPKAVSNHHPIDWTSRTMEIAIQTARRGAADAREAAARTMTATGRFASRMVYTTCYTAAYGVVYPTVLLARSIPANNAAAQGLIDGAHAAHQKVVELCDSAPETRRATSVHRSSRRTQTKPSVSTVSPPARPARKPMRGGS
jgi:hypothetical protein